MEFDTSEVRRLAADLGRTPGRLVPEVTKATEDSAKRIQRALRADARGIGHAPHFPRSITYEMKPRVGVIGAEIGPDKDLKQGALGNILYFGTSKNGAVLDLNGPPDRERPRLEKDVRKIAGDLLP
jgi:hypothetical protein